MMSVTSRETLHYMKERGHTNSLSFCHVGVAPVLDVKAVFCLGKVSRVGCKAVKEQSGTKTVLATRVLPVFPRIDPARSSAGNKE